MNPSPFAARRPEPSTTPSLWIAPVNLAAGESARVGFKFPAGVDERSVVCTVRALSDGADVEIDRGLGWSALLNRHYAYVTTQDGGWLSSAITFKSRVTDLEIQLWSWPKPKPLVHPKPSLRLLIMPGGRAGEAVATIVEGQDD